MSIWSLGRLYAEAEETGRQQGRGLWTFQDPMPPWEVQEGSA
jgi:endonuclease YncB( thermonuclease family)